MDNKIKKLLEIYSKTLKSIDCDELENIIKKQENYFLIDICEKIQVKKVHIPTAIKISRSILEGEIEKHTNNINDFIILYSKQDIYSRLSAYNLINMGYKKVFYLKGGILQWYKSNKALSDKNID